MRNFLKDYFHYTKSERNGFITLVIICLLFLLAPSVHRYFFPVKIVPITIEGLPSKTTPTSYEKTDIPLFEFNPNKASVEDFVQLGLSPKIAARIIKYRKKGGSFRKKEDFKKVYGIKNQDYERLSPYISLPNQTASKRSKNIPNSYDKVPTKPIELFSFDPNTISKEDLKRLGLSNRVVSTIINFRSKGRFRKANDFKKIFGLTETTFLRLRPYIEIVKESTFKEQKYPKSTAKDTTRKIVYTQEKIDINLAAREEWELVYGIGKVLSKRIVGYREALGGFHSIEQVSTVYGIEDSTFQKISPQLVLTPFEIKKLNINIATKKELSAHPLLNSRQAQIIVNYRENHGAYTSTDDLKNIRAFDTDFLKALVFYVDVE